ncbi:hypothetical protein [Nocardiopsis sp. CA-288880]|uniref:hypothetical protein n=1 Tax=Nocardiopsis sp. CA-288880 TaxID=3239995 RepID=UPI003D971FDC
MIDRRPLPGGSSPVAVGGTPPATVGRSRDGGGDRAGAHGVAHPVAASAAFHRRETADRCAAVLHGNTEDGRAHGFASCVRDHPRCPPT